MFINTLIHYIRYGTSRNKPNECRGTYIAGKKEAGRRTTSRTEDKGTCGLQASGSEGIEFRQCSETCKEFHYKEGRVEEDTRTFRTYWKRSQAKESDKVNLSLFSFFSLFILYIDLLDSHPHYALFCIKELLHTKLYYHRSV